jgi:dihydrofolate synthase/folylpolyglutamate synthase
LTKRESKASSPYRTCLDWLFARHRFVMKPGLDRVEHLLRGVESPHEAFRVVQVGGTNGKGSTSSMIASVLTQAGLKTGLYTSPHVIDFTERIGIDGRPIARDRVVKIVDRLRPFADEIEATFFEITTAVAALYFAEEGVDLAVAEVGLGGRLDATSALDAVQSVITRVAIDHAEILGSDTAMIAAEKAGIIREGGLVVSGATGDALDVIRGAAAAKGARVVSVAEESSVGGVTVSANGSVFDFEYGDTALDGLSVSMLGRHQVENARTAIVSIVELNRAGAVSVSEAAIRAGLTEARPIGRLQIIDRRPTVVADVAHNPDGAAALAAALAEVFDYDHLIMVVGIMGDKDVRGFLAAFAECVDQAVVTRPETPRAAAPEDVAAIASELGIRSLVVPTAGAAVARALALACDSDLVLITGSHYTVGDVMTSLGVGQALEAG